MEPEKVAQIVRGVQKTDANTEKLFEMFDEIGALVKGGGIEQAYEDLLQRKLSEFKLKTKGNLAGDYQEDGRYCNPLFRLMCANEFKNVADAADNATQAKRNLSSHKWYEKEKEKRKERREYQELVTITQAAVLDRSAAYLQEQSRLAKERKEADIAAATSTLKHVADATDKLRVLEKDVGRDAVSVDSFHEDVTERLVSTQALYRKRYSEQEAVAVDAAKRRRLDHLGYAADNFDHLNHLASASGNPFAESVPTIDAEFDTYPDDVVLEWDGLN